MPSEYIPKPNGDIDNSRQVDFDQEMAAIETEIELLGENWPADPIQAIRKLWRIRRRTKEARQLVNEMLKSREHWWALAEKE